MSCTVSELPSGCRLRGMGSASQASSNVPLTGGGSVSGGGGVGGVGSGGGSGGNGSGSGTTTVVAPGGIHVGGILTTTSALSTGNNNALQEAPLQRQQSQKPCCFCWCCCCSCSWAKCEQSQYTMAERWKAAMAKMKKSLAIKNAEDNGPTKRDPASSDLLLEGEQPTLEEIRSWGKSFEKLMKSPGGRKVFRDFLRCEYSEENILFWLACEELKKESSPESVEHKARLIYEDYISILSPKEVSLDSRVRETVNRNMIEPTTHTFDEAQIQIYTLMHRDSYPRFINSQLFKSLAQLPEGASASGSRTESPT